MIIIFLIGDDIMGSVQITDHKVTEEIDKDYSLEKVPRSQRNMGWLSITNITFGIEIGRASCRERV